jgi:hypothetical protein
MAGLSAEASHETRPAFGGTVKLRECGQSAGKSFNFGLRIVGCGFTKLCNPKFTIANPQAEIPLNDYTPDPDSRKRGGNDIV